MTAFQGLLADDPHDAELVASVHPARWQAPAPAPRYNLVVVGAGTAGLVCAAGAAALGARVALVERELMGGDCLNYGCVPSKALIHEARIAHTTGRSADFAALMARLRARRAHIGHHDSAERFRGLGVDVFLGHARFTACDRLDVGGATLRFARAVIATGARAARLPVPGLGDVGYLTNETVFALTARPRRLAVIGAGPIGCELAQAFRRLGAEVTVVALDPRVLPKDDPDAAALVHRRLESEGVRLVLGTRLARVERRGPDKVIVHDRGEVIGDEILVAAGRQPNVENLGLETAGVAHGKTGITVDDRLRTSNRRIYASGDVCSRFQFTHAADAMSRIVLRNALFFGRARASALVIPWASYTDPEVAHVGVSADEARDQGLATLTVEMGEVDRAFLEDDPDGFARVHVDRKGRIRGATIVTRGAGDLIGEVSLAMTHGLGLPALSSTIHPYPTRAEVLRKLGDAYQRTRLTPGLRRWFARFLGWRR
jgi:pyruvate/2-oxoglutarate dehydrogenase complex dihydrolipoamide dehydrogenase (E3) component